jgi:glycosyltransferase involved in cell wall biosynthesis
MIIANSAAGIAGYRALGLISHERTVQIGNCIDTKRFHPPSLERRLRARTHFEIPPNLNVVAYVGRDAPEKDLKLLVRSLSELPLHVQRLLVIVVGVSEQRLTELAASEGVRLPSSMQVHARMQNIEDVYMATDVLLLTSRHEGSPNVVHEARACGVAIVSTDCGDVRETMQAQDRVVRSDPSCLAEAVAAVLKIGLDQRVPPSPMSPTDCARRWAAAIESILPSEA